MPRLSEPVRPEQRAAAARALQAELLATIPLTRAMALEVGCFDGYTLELSAPLAPNVNDKGCAFGGSMASLLTLACWGLAKLAIEESGAPPADLFVQDSRIDYLAPVWCDLDVRASAADGAALQDFVRQYGERGKARITLSAMVGSAAAPAARMEARFVAKRREEKA
jgi:thioesterase domain-containing protein